MILRVFILPFYLMFQIFFLNYDIFVNLQNFTLRDVEWEMEVVILNITTYHQGNGGVKKSRTPPLDRSHDFTK